MSIEQKIFEFTVDVTRVEVLEAEDFIIHTKVRFSDISKSDFLDWCRERNLRVGLRIFETHSRSPLLSEFRATEVADSGEEQVVKARFSVPRRLFADQQCRIAQIDLMYEGKFWFEQFAGAAPFLPIWVEKPAVEVDIFDYYFQTYGKR